MKMMDQFLWVIFPYMCVVVFIVGHVYRYRTDQFNWTAKSSEFIEKKHLKLGSLMFHLGIIPVIGGHIVGLGIPQSWMEGAGIDDHLYHIGAVYVGGVFGLVTLAGMLLLTARRFTFKNVRLAQLGLGFDRQCAAFIHRVYGHVQHAGYQLGAAGFQLPGEHIGLVPGSAHLAPRRFVDARRSA